MKLLVSLGLLVLFASIVSAGYSYDTFVDTENSNATQHRLYLDGHHFITVIGNGTFNIRPHPGVDENGWGSSLYLQPFISGAILNWSSVESVNVGVDGIEVRGSGFVSKDAADSFGIWNASLFFGYDPVLKEINGSGNYNVSLDGGLSGVGNDLNLYKLASNYLDDVPLVTGVIGDTGDMQNASVAGDDGFRDNWNPADMPGHFPQDRTDWLDVNVSGNLNNVNTTEQGFGHTEPKYVPSLRVKLVSHQPGIPMIFGGFYNTSLSRLFWEDNVGITPLILQESVFLNYEFDVEFFSAALLGDGNDLDFDGYLIGEDCDDGNPMVFPDSNGLCVSDSYLTVCKSGACDYISISDAEKNATSNNVIIVLDEEVYEENVLLSAGNNVTLDCNGATLLGNGTGIGINTGFFSTTIKNCIIRNYYQGIFNHFDRNYKILNNTLVNNTFGIYLDNSDNMLIRGNNISNNMHGIKLYFEAVSNIIEENFVSNNKRDGIILSWRSNGNTVRNNYVEGNRYGIYSDCPFQVHQSNNNDYEGNVLVSNDRGFNFVCSHRNNVIDNLISKNSIGINFFNSNGSLIYNNVFNNSVNAMDSGINSWNASKTSGVNIINGSFLGGNFWSDYFGSDFVVDGIGDTDLPHNSSGNILIGGDYFPLVYPEVIIPVVPGDWDGDGVVNATDINLLCEGINTGNHIFDLNFDGVLNESDLVYYVENYNSLLTVLGDANLDKRVDAFDLSLVRIFFGQNLGWDNGDFNCDFSVDAFDLAIVRENFGYSGSVDSSGEVVDLGSDGGVVEVSAKECRRYCRNEYGKDIRLCRGSHGVDRASCSELNRQERRQCVRDSREEYRGCRKDARSDRKLCFAECQ